MEYKVRYFNFFHQYQNPRNYVEQNVPFVTIFYFLCEPHSTTLIFSKTTEERMMLP